MLNALTFKFNFLAAGPSEIQKKNFLTRIEMCLSLLRLKVHKNFNNILLSETHKTHRNKSFIFDGKSCTFADMDELTDL